MLRIVESANTRVGVAHTNTNAILGSASTSGIVLHHRVHRPRTNY